MKNKSERSTQPPPKFSEVHERLPKEFQELCFKDGPAKIGDARPWAWPDWAPEND